MSITSTMLNRSNLAAASWQNALSRVGRCPIDDGRKAWVWKAACACAYRRSTISCEQATEFILSELPAGYTGMSSGDVADKVSKAYGTQISYSTSAIPKIAATYDPVELRRQAERVLPVTREKLQRLSPVNVDIGPEEFLKRLYRPGECLAIVVGENYPDGKPKWRDMRYRFDTLNADDDLTEFRSGYRYQAAGIWFMCQPVRSDAESWSEPNVTRWPFAVLEADDVDEKLWLRWLVQQPDIEAIYTSGGRSIHALQRIDATSKAHWDQIMNPRKADLTTMGADPRALSAVRLTRLPGCERTEKNGTQALLWFGPGNQKPIYKKEAP
jgi:hypothetical protein